MVVTANLAYAESSPNPNDEQMRALKQSVEAAAATYQAATNDVGSVLWRAYKQVIATNLPQILELAQKNPAGQTAFEMFSWVAMKGSAERGPVFTNRIQAFAMLAKYHGSNSAVGPLCGFIGHSWVWRWREKPVVDFLQAVVVNNPVRAIRAQAIYALGCLDANKSEQLAEFENWSQTPFYAKTVASNDLVELPKFGTSHQAATEAENKFSEIISHYADCLELRERRNPKDEAQALKELAEQNLSTLKRFSLGTVAPDIAAESIKGQKFKLSDSRGRITVLSFWASWCSPCMQLVPVERALSEQMKGRPFALIGVNGDGVLADAQRAVAHEQMTWPSFWNGKGGSDGPISSAWNISGWPTVYVLDANGIIRLKFEGYGDVTSNILNGSVEVLMKELERTQK